MALNDDGTEITFTPDDDLPQNTEHCLNIATDVTDEAGNALGSAHETCFTTDCSSGAEFDNENELGCFTLFNVAMEGVSQETLPGSFLDDATVAGGLLTLDHNTTNSGPGGNGVPAFFKEISGGDFSVEILVTGGLPTNIDSEAVALVLSGASDIFDVAILVYDFDSGDDGLAVHAFSMVNGVEGIEEAAELTTNTIYLRLARSGTTLTYAYKISAGADYTVLATEDRNSGGDILGGDSEPLFIGIVTWTDNELGTFVPEIDHFRFLTGSAEGQE